MTYSLFVFSDTHIGAIYSNWAHDKPIVDEGIQSHNEIHFLGDGFEFMHRYCSTKDLLGTAGRVIDGWVKKANGKPFHYDPGNHDCVIEFRDLLEEKARQHPNFFWHANGIVRGNAYYGHGHNLIGEAGIKKGRQMPGFTPTEFIAAKQMLYPLVKRAIHSAAGFGGPLISSLPSFYPIEKTAELLANRVDDVPIVEKTRKKIEHVFVGHLHTRNGVVEYSVGDKAVHVTGASILTPFSHKNCMLSVTLDDKDNVLSVERFQSVRARASRLFPAVAMLKAKGMRLIGD